MKGLFTLIIVILFSAGMLGQNNTTLNHEQTMLVAKKLMKYYNQYENGAPIALKKAKFNEYVDEVNPNLSPEDRKKSFAIVDAYISASKGKKIDLNLTPEQEQELSKMLAEAQQKEQEGMQAMLVKVQEIKNMSYAEYKKFVTHNGQITLPESDIQKAYNQMHKNDGKQVKLTKKKSKIDNPVMAIDIVQHPEKHNYQEFKAAMKFLKPDISQEEIQKIWNKQNHK